MSHAWGQTVPSNYGRLPSSRQREFHTDPGAGEALELVIKQTMQELTHKNYKEKFKKKLPQS